MSVYSTQSSEDLNSEAKVYLTIYNRSKEEFELEVNYPGNYEYSTVESGSFKYMEVPAGNIRLRVTKLKSKITFEDSKYYQAGQSYEWNLN